MGHGLRATGFGLRASGFGLQAKSMMLRDLVFRLRALVRPAQAERDLDDELAFHMERETEKLVASGMSRVDARLRALSRFGSRLVVADECRDVRGTGAVE